MNVQIADSYGLFINGEFVEATSGKTIDVYCPANGNKISEIAEASNEDVDRAIEAAHAAFKTWSQTSVKERADILVQIADVIEENAEHLAMVETLDNGKPYRETIGADIPLAADHFRYFAGVIRSEEDSVKMLDNNTMSIILREPIGVVGQIVPWNFPFLMGAWKLAPVLAAGDCTVFKPSSTTSLSILELMKLIKDIVPAGVINIVTGKGSTVGQYLQEHTALDKIAFTGSTAVGREIGISAAKNLIPSTLELGGKSANIFFEDMNQELALEGVQMGILFNQGQVCSAGSRIFVQESVYDEFVPKLVEAFSKVKVGMPWEDGVQMGCQIDEKQVNTIQSYVDIGIEEGAKVLCGGKRYNEGPLSEGAFYQPTLLEATNDMRVSQEEIFGPVACVIKFKDADDVIEMANDSVYGLGGGVWTSDLNTAFKVARGVRTGRMWVNTYASFEAGAPFGGYKESGIGRETHKMILDSYTQTKNIYINLSEEGQGMY